MKVRIIRPCDEGAVGDIVDVPYETGLILVQRIYAEEVEGEPVKKAKKSSKAAVEGEEA
jgi:hypothetical protein